MIHLLFAAALLMRGSVRADEPLRLWSPAPLILPQVKLQKSGLSDALQTLRQAAEQSSGGGVKTSFVLELPLNFQPPRELTAEWHDIPLPDAARYLSDLAGVSFFARGNAVVVRARQTVALTASPAPPAPPAPTASPLLTPPPSKGLTGALGKPSERVGDGAGLRRAMDGTVQPEQSGQVAHRALDGWSTGTKQMHVFEANCIRITQCPQGCGCFGSCHCRQTPTR